jgi:uncharacterized lipoprotein (TIGR02269 family)
MDRLPQIGLLLLWGLLASCASTHSVQREGDAETVSSWQEACEDARSLTFLCGEDACAFYRCAEVAPGRVVRAYSNAPVARPPLRAPGSTSQRYWGSAQGLPRDSQPVFIIPWYNDKPQRLLPALCEQQRKEAEELARKPRVKHHIFPQQQILKEWFESKGISVHQWTLVLFKDDHDRIHNGPEGGPWNEAWRQYMRANRGATKEAIWRYAGELIYRFELYGPVIPYHRRELPALCIPQP